MPGAQSFDDPAIGFDDPTVGFDGNTTSGLPTITSVSPNTSDVAGGVQVSITGTGFGTAPPTSRFTWTDSGWAIPIFYITPNITATLNRVQAEGGKSLRFEADMSSLQPTNPGSKTAGNQDALDPTNIALQDQVYAGCLARGIHPIMNPTYCPDWAHPGHTGNKVPPTRDQTHYADFANFCALMANRYPLASFEIWNEPNISTFWKQPASTSTTGAVDSPDVFEYSKLLAASYTAIKTGVVHAAGGDRTYTPQPNVLVVTGGSSPASGAGGGANYDPRLWLAGILIDAPTSFDHVGIHWYMWQQPATGTQDYNPLFQMLAMWQALKAAGRSDADFWGTEGGAITRPDNSGTDPSSPFGVGGYATGAPSGSYNTSARAITYTLAKQRVQQYITAWTRADKFDATVGRFFTGPMSIFMLNDHAAPTDWSGSDEDHYGTFEGAGYAGAAKPEETKWTTLFAPAGGGSGGASLSVTVGGTAATIVSSTDTAIVITVPAHAAGIVDVVVTTNAGPTVPDIHSKFTYTSTGPAGSPVVTGLFPSFGPFSGGTHVTVVGTDLDTATSISFGGTPGTILPTPTATSLIAVAPAHAPGVVDVTVTNPSGPSGTSGADQYTYTPPTPPTPTGRQWKIMARNDTGVLGQVEDFGGVVFVKNHNDVGTWTSLTIPASSPMASVLVGPNAGIVILADDKVEFSGPVRDVVRAATADGVQQLVLSGVDDNFWLRARLAHPDPSTATVDVNYHYVPNAYDTRTGTASTVMGQYVAVNAAGSAIARRVVPNLSVAPDPVVGGSVTGNARWQTLLDVLQQLALQSIPAVTFDVLQSGNALLFTVSLPTDHSTEGDGKVVFSPQAGTLGQYTYERQAANANYVYAGGVTQINFDARTRLINEWEDPDDIAQWGLVEEFLDRRDITGPAVLRQAAAAEVLQQAGIFRTDLGVIDTAGVEWGVDYDVGDRVTVVVDGVPLVELVRSVQVTLGPNGDTEQIVPSVSSPSRKRTVQELHYFSTLRDLASRIANLERNV